MSTVFNSVKNCLSDKERLAQTHSRLEPKQAKRISCNSSTFRPTSDGIQLENLVPFKFPGEPTCPFGAAAAGLVPQEKSEQTLGQMPEMLRLAPSLRFSLGHQLSPRGVSSLRRHVASQTRRNMCAVGFDQLSSFPSFSTQQCHLEPLGRRLYQDKDTHGPVGLRS